MKVTRLVLGMTLVPLILCSALRAQQQSPGYHAVACFKLKPDSTQAFKKFVSDEVHKLAQARVDSGQISAWYLLRSIFPQGESAECDYIIVNIFPGNPKLLTNDVVEAAIKKAGLTITADDYFKHRDAVTRLIANAIYQTQAAVGAPQKGDVFQVSYMKVAPENVGDWIDLETKIWKPFAEQMVKDGAQHAWSLNTAVFPGGTELPYQGVTVDVYPSMDTVFNGDSHFLERFKKVHPDLEFGFTIQRFERLRTQAKIYLYSLDDYISAH